MNSNSFIKYFLSILIIFNTFAIGIANGEEFFLDNIIECQPEISKLDDINITNGLSFSNQGTEARYNSSKKFITQLKNGLKINYQNNKYDYYIMTDAINNLDYMTYSLNRYFVNTSKFEQTGNTDYKNIANDYLEESKEYYNQLKGSFR
ncbi:MAG: hypothetical protein PHF46_00830 [Candidatus Gracilibacteria bacterium]|nr:hypothetical protein [Candidatus Gracilibacteria bacterium]MDD3119936.1 hypothetical protein [Candidatus Gracilibacteria bacterium]MDD4530156.1 hypothetical protein [Candidatus Gracilibacteria bacterium]